MDWLQRHVPWVSDFIGLLVLVVGAIGALVGALVKSVLDRRDLVGIKKWQAEHEKRASERRRELFAIEARVKDLSGRFSTVERAQIDAAARANEDRTAIREALDRIESRLDTQLSGISGRIDQIVGMRGK